MHTDGPRMPPFTPMLKACSVLTLLLTLSGQLLAQTVPDPFSPPSSLTIEAPQELAPEAGNDSAPLVLQATRISGNKRHAVINGSKLRVGDHINDAEVLSISAAAVRLLRDDEEFILEFPRSGIDKRPAAQ